MLLAMMSSLGRTAFPIIAAFAAIGLATLAHARTNPYQVIVERNPFGLKPVPLAVTETNQTAGTPPVKVVLTGITSMFGPSSKRVFLEMTEQQQPGKPAAAATPKRAMLGEGDREGDIEVVSINIEQNIVKIRNGSVESELTFEVVKPSPTPAGQVAANTASASPAAPASSQPIIISSSESRGGVTMAGGSSAFQGNTAGVTSFGGSTPMMAGNSGGVSSYGGISPTGAGGFGHSGTPALAASPSNPSRTLRVGPQQEIDPATRAVRYEASRMYYEEINKKLAQSGSSGYPPLPPTRYSQEIRGGPPPPLPGQ